jgi:hypothetical protein
MSIMIYDISGIRGDSYNLTGNLSIKNLICLEKVSGIQKAYVLFITYARNAYNIFNESDFIPLITVF